MVDYKLVIDIDENELVRKLNNALKKAGALGFGATGGSGSGGAQRQARPGYSPSIGLSEAGARKVAEYQTKRDAYERSKINIMNLEFAKKTAYQELVQAGRMERLQASNNSWQKKMFSLGTVVKLAGLATGVAGLLQFRKMIIDSSPMLQAMLRLLDTGVMFYLRPIGDFIGFFLRPLLIPFLKAAVKFYSTVLPKIIKYGGAAGEAAAKGELGESGKQILTMFEEIQQDSRPKSGPNEPPTVQDIIDNSPHSKAAQLLDIKEIFKFLIDFATGKLNLGFSGEAGGCPGGGAKTSYCDSLYKNSAGGALTDIITGKGINYTRSLSDSMSTGDSLGKGGANTNLGFQSQFYHPMEQQRREYEEKYQSMEDKYVKSITGGAYANPNFLCGGLGASQDIIDNLTKQLKEAEDTKETLKLTGRSTESIDKQIGKLNDLISQQIKGLYAQKGGFEKANSGRTRGCYNTSNIKTYSDALSGTLNDYGNTTKCPYSQKYKDANPKSFGGYGKLKTNASGGMINEMIYGTGVSGRKYTFGESGPEMIIPSGQTNQAVGQFQGASNYKIKSQYDKMIQLKQMMEEAHSIYGPQVSALTSAQSGMKVPTSHGRINKSRIGDYKDKIETLERKISSLSDSKHQFDAGYKGAFSEFGSSAASAGESGVLSALGGERTREISGGSNTFNINIAKASNIEDLVRQLGPKILKYLQENDARAGIR